MEALNKCHVDLERGGDSSAAIDGKSDRTSTSSDAAADDERSWHSPLESAAGGTSSGEQIVAGAEIVGDLEKGRESSASECSVEVDLERGLSEIKAHLAKSEKDCRICHLSLDASNQESGIPIELGCSCKDDLAAAHKQCAETWFKIRGNKTCEICGSTARNVAGASESELVEQQRIDSNDAVAAVNGSASPTETRNFWQGHKFLNFLLACMVFAFVLSWLFHFNVPS